MRWLDKLLSDLHKRIASNSARLSAPQKIVYLPEDQKMLDNMTKQIEEMLEKAEKFGEEGEVDAAEAVTMEAEALKGRKDAYAQQAEARSGGNITKNLIQAVCPVSGLIINEEESRMRDHKAGRNYMAWKKLHEVHAAIEEVLKKRSEERPHHGSSRYDDRDRRSDRDRGRDRPRERPRDRDRRHHRSRSFDRDRNRRRSRSRDRSGIGSGRYYTSANGRVNDGGDNVMSNEEKKGGFVRARSPIEEGEAPLEQS